MIFRTSADICLNECDDFRGIYPKYLDSDLDHYSSEMFDLLMQAIESGDQYASYALANCHHMGHAGLEENLDKALEWYLYSFNKNGNICGGLEAARIHWFNKEYEAAYEIYIKLSHIENHIALTALGVLYTHGLGVEKDLREALKHFGKAEQEGNLTAPLEMAKIHMKNGKFIGGIILFIKTILKRFYCLIRNSIDNCQDLYRWQ